MFPSLFFWWKNTWVLRLTGKCLCSPSNWFSSFLMYILPVMLVAIECKTTDPQPLPVVATVQYQLLLTQQHCNTRRGLEWRKWASEREGDGFLKVFYVLVEVLVVSCCCCYLRLCCSWSVSWAEPLVAAVLVSRVNITILSCHVLTALLSSFCRQTSSSGFLWALQLIFLSVCWVIYVHVCVLLNNIFFDSPFAVFWVIVLCHKNQGNITTDRWALLTIVSLRC